MKINLENMKGLAEKLDNDDARFPLTLTPDDMCRMAYQLQYFFEAMEKIDKESNFSFYPGVTPSEEYRQAYIRGHSSAMRRCFKELNNALIHKEDEYTLDA